MSVAHEMHGSATSSSKEGDTVVGKVPTLAADAVEQQTSLWERLF